MEQLILDHMLKDVLLMAAGAAFALSARMRA